MKPLISLVLITAFSLPLSAQKLSTQKSILINELNRKVKECNDNIRFMKKGDKKTVIENASFTATDFGVKYSFDLKQASYPVVTYIYEFRPEDIQFIYNQDLPAESPVGQIKISLEKTLGIRTDNYVKKSKFVQTIINFANINFLQVDKKNFNAVQKTLFDLKKAYLDEKDEPLNPLVKNMKRYKDFWVSSKGESNTYKLYDVIESGCTLRFDYSLQTISTSADSKNTYITVVRLDEIIDAWFDAGKTKPGCIILQSGKKGFETFKKKGSEYLEAEPVKEIPLFINIEFSFERQDILDLLNNHIKQCGGKKIKM